VDDWKDTDMSVMKRLLLISWFLGVQLLDRVTHAHLYNIAGGG
jgi:hypothetical protein